MTLLRWFRAKAGGYFWLPCPNCGRPFGGHEQPNGQLLTGPGTAKVTCPRCPHTYITHNGHILRTEAMYVAKDELVVALLAD